MSYFDFREFEKKVSGARGRHWPTLKFYLYTLHRSVIVGTPKRKVVYIPFILILLWSSLLFLVYVLRSRLVRPLRGLVFGASTRLDRDGDWLLGNDFRRERAQLYHVHSFDFAMLRLLVQHRVVAHNLLVRVLAKLTKLLRVKDFAHLSLSDRELIDLICQSELVDKLGIERDGLKEILENHLIDYQIHAATQTFLLKLLRVNCREAVVVSGYSKCDVVSALHALGYHVTDYQHGLVAPFHPVNICSREITSDLLVDQHALMSEFWANLVAKYSDTDSMLYTPAFHRFDHDQYDITKPYAVFSSQDENADAAVAFIDAFLSTNSSLTLVYRLHPRETLTNTKVYKRFKDSERVIFSSILDSRSTRAIIKGAVAHFSMSSACHFDAFELLGESYFVQPVNNSLFPSELLDGDLAPYAKAAADFRYVHEE